MKIRPSFVSNSSSSSFIAIGYEFDLLPIRNVLINFYGLAEEMLEGQPDSSVKDMFEFERSADYPYVILSSVEEGAPEGKMFFGKILADKMNTECCFESIDIDAEIEEIKSALLLQLDEEIDRLEGDFRMLVGQRTTSI